MSEILDEQVPEVQPEAETFRQGVSEPEPAPEPVPAPEPEPEPEAQPEPVVPDWLNEPEPEPAPMPNYPPQPHPQYPPNVPQQPPQQPPRSGDISAFVDDPDGYIETRARQLVEQMVGPIAYQQNLIQQRTNEMHRAQVNSGASAVDNAINRAYSEFNKDSSFRSDKGIQERIKGLLKNMKAQAVYEAQTSGDFTKMYNMANIGEQEIKATLAVAKIQAGIAGSSSAPLDIRGAEVASSRPSVPKPQIQLTGEQQAIADRFGGDYADRLRKAIAETQDAGDFEG